MKKMVYYSTSFVLIFLLSLQLNGHEQAIICVPIADLIGQSMRTIYSNTPTYDAYKNLPLCWKKNPQYACPRLHQLVYNDIVDVVSMDEDEACILIKNLFYITHSSTTPQTSYWTHRKNIVLLKDLAAHHITSKHIPQPYTFIQSDQKQPQQHIATLITPHYDPTTHITFSVGTRFVCAQKPKKAQKKIKVFAIDFAKNKEKAIVLPAEKCYLHTATTAQEQVQKYVALLKSWANQKDSFIPYVWGGTSFTTTLNTPFQETTKETNGVSYSFFEIENDTTSPKSGFDCSGVIGRAAQICDIPYFYKNTTTIDAHLAPLEQTDTIINGDLILIKGHVMIVSDIENNLLIEARGYSHGYGRLHEIALNKIFNGIETYKDLCDAFFNKKGLTIKDINGNNKNTYKDWKILKIMSVYK